MSMTELQERRVTSQSSGKKLASVAAAVLGSLSLLVVCGTVFIVSLLAPSPVEDLLSSRYPLPVATFGCVLLYVSARLWSRWRLGAGVAMVIFGVLVTGEAMRLQQGNTIPDATVRSAYFVGFVSTDVAGVLVGLGLIAWQKLLDRKRRNDESHRPE